MAKRLFVALELPETVKARLTAIAQGLSGTRWVKPSHIHLTLRFIGEADDSLFERIRTCLSGVQFSSFALELVGTGCFPPRGLPRILWAGVSPLQELETLYRMCESALVSTGVPPETRQFRPHITLARMNNPSLPAVAAYLKRTSDFRSGSFPVSSFTLFSSLLTPKGPIHTPEATYPLISSSP